MKDENKTKAELIKELKFLREEREKGVFKDITERIQVEKELKDSEERLKTLFDYAPDAYYISDLKGNFVDGNKAAERLIGYKKEELSGRNFLKLKLLSLVDIPKVAKLLAKNLRRLPTGPDEFVLNRKDNSKITVEISTYPVKIKGRALALGIARDITEREKAVKALRNAKREKEIILDSLVEHVIYEDKKMKILWANKAACESAGLTREELVGRYCYEIWPKRSEPCPDCPVVKAIKKKKPQEIEKSTPDGKVWFIRGYPIQDKKGDIVGGIEVTFDITERKQAEERLKKTLDATIETMSKIIEVKDPYTAGHQQRVSQLTTAIAKELNLSPDKVEGIRVASLIHDIGKISVPTEILSKTTKLSDIEFSLIKEHSQIGSDILKAIDFSYPVAQIVLQHHEKVNGSGYPNKLKGDKILLEARIIGVADVVEAMSSHRPYRPSLGINVALEEITQNKGILYDPEVVDVCLKLFKEKGFKFE